MDERHIGIEDLSAYLDGECENAEQVKAHGSSCPECAARYKELRAVAASVRSLRAPDARPEFVARVMARVAEPAPHWTARLFQWPVLAGGLTAAVLALFVAALQPWQWASPDLPKMDEDTMTATLQRPEIAAALDEEPDWLSADASADVSDESMAEWTPPGWFEAVAENIEQYDDIDDIINGLNPGEVSEFKRLINQYREEGLQT